MTATKPLDVFEAMRRRRMHRLFTSEPVESKRLEQLVYAAGRAPAARPDLRHLVVVEDAALLKTIEQVCPGYLANAPALIVICSDARRAGEVLGPRGVELVTRLDSGAAAGYLTLAAPAMDLGVCIVTSWTETAVQKVLDLPEHIRPDVIVAIGYPIEDPPRAVQRFKPIIHRETFGTEWDTTRH